MTSKKEKERNRDEAIALLKERMTPNTRIRFVCTYRSTSGYSTHGYAMFVAVNDPETGLDVHEITWLVKRATGLGSARFEDLRVTGCGFSKPQQIVDHLRQLLGGEYAASGWDDAAKRYRGLSWTM